MSDHEMITVTEQDKTEQGRQWVNGVCTILFHKRVKESNIWTDS